jgi:hypothetical protein
VPVEPMVIHGQVRARLLGIPLLTLAARIIAESQEPHVLVIPAAGPRASAPAELEPQPGSARLTRVIADGGPAADYRPGHRAVGEPGTGVARARQLVRENARQLARGRGIPGY